MNSAVLERESLTNMCVERLQQPLAHLLTVLEIDPFSKESVKTYQNTFAVEAKRRAKRDCSFYNLHKENFIFSYIGIILFGISGLLEGSFVLSLTQGIGLASIFLVAMYFLSRKDSADVFGFWERNIGIWKTYHLKWYLDDQRPVPEFALERVRYIQERAGTMKLEFYVQAFSQDPFLVVAHPSSKECYHIDVWDEREFERANLYR